LGMKNISRIIQGIYFFPVFILQTCVPIQQSSTFSEDNPKSLKLIDLTYEPQIKTVLLYSTSSDPQANTLQPAITRLGEWTLQLEFDDLSGQRDSYYARVVHCNHDWTKSELQDLDFMNQFNEFPITDFEFSVNTHIPYVHCRFTLPPVKLPGNYVLVVYRGSDRNDVILSKRFMVFESQVIIKREGSLVGPGTVAELNQQINFKVDYKNIDVVNPMENIHVNIRQNQRWDNMQVNIQPSFIRENIAELEYRFFDRDKMFKGGNEFRWFDLRSLNYPGRNVVSVNKTIKPNEVYIAKDKNRSDEAYSQYDDLNGDFLIVNLDYPDRTTTEYAYINFTLESPPVDGNVYVTGAFNYWNENENNLMHYNTTAGAYEARVLLKQGWYDYLYQVQSSALPPYYFEGSYFQTENFYEIFVYYRPFQPRADLLVGYVRLDENKR
jgi:hypothetical protein